MGEAITYALKEKLQGEFTENDKKAWDEVYQELSSDIIKSMEQ